MRICTGVSNSKRSTCSRLFDVKEVVETYFRAFVHKASELQTKREEMMKVTLKDACRTETKVSAYGTSHQFLTYIGGVAETTNQMRR